MKFPKKTGPAHFLEFTVHILKTQQEVVQVRQVFTTKGNMSGTFQMRAGILGKASRRKDTTILLLKSHVVFFNSTLTPMWNLLVFPIWHLYQRLYVCGFSVSSWDLCFLPVLRPSHVRRFINTSIRSLGILLGGWQEKFRATESDIGVLTNSPSFSHRFCSLCSSKLSSFASVNEINTVIVLASLLLHLPLGKYPNASFKLEEQHPPSVLSCWTSSRFLATFKQVAQEVKHQAAAARRVGLFYWCNDSASRIKHWQKAHFNILQNSASSWSKHWTETVNEVEPLISKMPSQLPCLVWTFRLFSSEPNHRVWKAP